MSWYCSHSAAHFGTVYLSWGEGQDSCTLGIPNNLKGEKVRLTFSNRYGKEPFPMAGVRLAVEGGEERSLSFDGSESVVLPAGGRVTSDELEFAVTPGERLLVTMQFTTTEKPASGYDYEGKTVAAFEELDVYCENEPKVIVCFGDSITKFGMWTDPLRERLYKEYPGMVALSNKGISANRFLQDCIPLHKDAMGDSGYRRFEEDVLAVAGASHVIFALGTNDLGHPGEPEVPYEQLPTVEQFTGAMQELADIMKARGIVTIGTTILPRKLVDYYTPKKEELRLAINRWITESGCFDVVIDWAEFVRAEDGADGMKPEYDGDGLHPSAAGGRAMADYLWESYSFGLR